jgi:hypothetical protein
MMAAIRYGVGWKQAGEGFLASLVLSLDQMGGE